MKGSAYSLQVPLSSQKAKSLTEALYLNFFNRSFSFVCEGVPKQLNMSVIITDFGESNAEKGQDCCVAALL